MTTLREAAQQALEALEYGQHSLKQISEYQWESRGQLAMAALRAALAQQAEPVEPVAIVRWNDIGHISWRTLVMLPDNTPLYTAPPKLVPLTDEEIKRLWYDNGAGIELSRFSSIARAVERAHGIGGQDGR